MTPGLLPWLALSGALGAVLRHLVVRALTPMVRGTGSLRSVRPAGTAVVNLAGAAAAGFVLGASPGGAGSPLAVVLATGLLGAFTTYSAWMTEVIGLLVERRLVLALLHLAGLPLAGIAMAAAAFALAGGG